MLALITVPAVVHAQGHVEGSGGGGGRLGREGREGCGCQQWARPTPRGRHPGALHRSLASRGPRFDSSIRTCNLPRVTPSSLAYWMHSSQRQSSTQSKSMQFKATRPLYIGIANMLGAYISEAIMLPNPRCATGCSSSRGCARLRRARGWETEACRQVNAYNVLQARVQGLHPPFNRIYSLGSALSALL